MMNRFCRPPSWCCGGSAREEESTMNHRRDYEHSGLYRSRRGLIFGVLQGMADHLEFSVVWLRVLFVVVTLLTTVWPMLALYILAAVLMRPEPVVPFESIDDEEFYQSYTSSRSMALHRLKQTYDSLDRRIRRMEDIVTARDYDWERRFRR